jgi:ADP-heptose:LPS heptosyltransferase
MSPAARRVILRPKVVMETPPAPRAPAPVGIRPIYRYNAGGSIIATGDVRHIRGDRGVLIIRGGGLGDVLMTTPLLRALHATLGVPADYWTDRRYAAALERNPHVKNVHAIEDIDKPESSHLRSTYDAVIDLRGYVEQGEFATYHRVRSFLGIVNFTEEDAGGLHLDYYPGALEKAQAGQKIAQTGEGHDTSRPLIGYVWDSTTPSRNWSRETRHRTLAALIGAGYRVALLHHNPLPEMDGNPNLLNFAGRTSLRECAAILSHCAAVVTPDTGLYHVAAALQVPTAAYFGSFAPDQRVTHSPGRFLPLGVTRGACPVQPCLGYGCHYQGEHGESLCLKTTDDQLLAAIAGLIATDATKN